MKARSAVNQYQSAFSLIELIVTLAILAVLASIAAPLVEVTIQRNKEQELSTALRTIREAIDAYKQASDEGRISKSADESGYPKTLEVLVDGIEDARDPKKNKLYFLRRLPKDPMLISLPNDLPEWGLRSYQSTADNPEPGADVFDIYSLSNETGLNGVTYNQW